MLETGIHKSIFKLEKKKMKCNFKTYQEKKLNKYLILYKIN